MTGRTLGNPFKEGPKLHGKAASLESLETRVQELEQALKETLKTNELLLDSLPYPAMLIRKDRTILAANRTARDMGAVVGGFCWRDFGQSEFIPDEDKRYINEHEGNIPPNGTRCTFCLSDESLDKGKPTSVRDVEAHGRVWDTHWLPIDSQRYLHYAIDVTERKRTEEALRKGRDALSAQIADKTAELMLVNYELREETEERRRADKALRESEHKFRALFDSALNPILIADDEGKYTDANLAACSLFGLRKDELIGRSIKDFAEPGFDFETLWKSFLEAREQTGEFRLVRPDGVIREVDYCATAEFIPGRHLCILHDITSRKQMEEAIRKSERELRYLSSRLLTIQEEEKARLARELHDTTTQTLVAIKYGLEVAIEGPARDRLKRDAGALERLVPMVQEALERVRSMYMSLRPTILDDFGLIEAIGWLCREASRSNPAILIKKQVHVSEQDIPEALKTIVFRVVQESLDNIAKHSKATLVSVCIGERDGALEICIQDNGVGFSDEDSLADECRQRGIGLASMKERVRQSGGTFSVDCQVGKGTRVKAKWKVGEQGGRA